MQMPSESGKASAEKEAAEKSVQAESKEIPVPQNEPIRLTDGMGNELQLVRPAQRVIALDAADCEIVYALGGGDLLVGRGAYCDYPAEAAELPAVQSGYETNVEEIIALQPELVITSSMNQKPEPLEALRRAGIAVLESETADIAGIYENISRIGLVLGKTQEAQKLTADMQEKFAALSAEKEKNAGKTVYFEASPLEYGLWTGGSGTFVNEIAECMGLTNCFADVRGWGQISEEQVIAKDPDYIITLSMYSGGEDPAEEILGRKGWEGIKAVQKKAVLGFSDDILTRPSYRLAEGAQRLAQFVREH